MKLGSPFARCTSTVTAAASSPSSARLWTSDKVIVSLLPIQVQLGPPMRRKEPRGTTPVRSQFRPAAFLHNAAPDPHVDLGRRLVIFGTLSAR